MAERSEEAVRATVELVGVELVKAEIEQKERLCSS